MNLNLNPNNNSPALKTDNINIVSGDVSQEILTPTIEKQATNRQSQDGQSVRDQLDHRKDTGLIAQSLASKSDF